MSDARWTEIDDDVAAAAEHFGRAVELFAVGGFKRDGLDGYTARMAFMHAMQSGHTSLESALVRILGLLNEEAPSGREWHADLVRRAGKAVAGRKRDQEIRPRRDAQLRHVRAGPGPPGRAGGWDAAHDTRAGHRRLSPQYRPLTA